MPISEKDAQPQTYTVTTALLNFRVAKIRFAV